jgi:hypothetical protein
MRDREMREDEKIVESEQEVFELARAYFGLDAPGPSTKSPSAEERAVVPIIPTSATTHPVEPKPVGPAESAIPDVRNLILPLSSLAEEKLVKTYNQTSVWCG